MYRNDVKNVLVLYGALKGAVKLLRIDFGVESYFSNLRP